MDTRELRQRIYADTYYWVNALRKEITNITTEASTLAINPDGSLVFSASGVQVLTLSPTGALSINESPDIMETLAALTTRARMNEGSTLCLTSEVAPIAQQVIDDDESLMTFTNAGTMENKNIEQFTNGTAVITTPTTSGVLALDDETLVKTDKEQTLTNKTIASFKSGSATITTPTTTGTLALTSDIPSTSGLVTLNTAQEITGEKTFKGKLTVENSSRTLYHKTEGGTTYGASFPASSGTVVTTTASQTLTNKTIASFKSGSATITAPTTTGTLALTTDIPSASNFVTLNSSQDITGAKTFKSNLTVENSGRTLYHKTVGGTTYGASFPAITDTVVTTMATQTLYNKILEKPTFSNFETSLTYTNYTYLVDDGKQYDAGFMHIYINATKHAANRGGSTTPNYWFKVNLGGVYRPSYSIPVFIQSQTWYGEKGLSGYINSLGECYVINNVGVTQGQYVYIFAIWFG